MPNWRRSLTAGLLVGAFVVLLVVVAPRLRRPAEPPVHPAERHYQSGLAHARAGNGQKAVSDWNLAIAMNPADARPYDALVEHWEGVGRPDLAVATLERLTLANPAAPHRDCRLARAAFAAGWVSRASEAAERAVQSEPGCPLAHTMLGIVLEDAGEAERAIVELQQAHRLSPSDARIALTLAQVEGRTGRRDAALRRVRELLQQDARSRQAHYLMGWLLARSQPHTTAADTQAISHLRQVLAQEPQHGAALAELGALHARRGEFSQARTLLEQAHSQNVADPEAAQNLALVWARLRDPRASKLAAAARHLEERQHRRRALRRRHLLHPTDHNTTLHLARLERDDGQVPEATDLVRQVLRADPNHQGALDLMHELLGTPTVPTEPLPSQSQPSPPSLPGKGGQGG